MSKCSKPAKLNQEMVISLNQYWGRHRSEIEHLPDARRAARSSRE